MDKREAKQYSPLALAYLGDAVYERLVRKMLVQSANMSAGKLHKKGVHLVNAHYQASCAKVLESCLTEEESDILRRGRNAKSLTVPKNADVIEYKLATGLEALFGYLELIGDKYRIDEIFKMCMDIADSGGNENA